MDFIYFRTDDPDAAKTAAQLKAGNTRSTISGACAPTIRTLRVNFTADNSSLWRNRLCFHHMIGILRAHQQVNIHPSAFDSANAQPKFDVWEDKAATG
jgi:hypothetical protein